MTLFIGLSPLNILKNLLGNPATTTEFAIMGFMGLAALLVAIRVFGGILGCSIIDWGRSILSTLITTGLLLGGFIAIQHYLLPQIQKPVLQQASLITVMFILFFGIVVPLSKLMVRGKYTQVLCTLLLSLAAAGSILLLTHAGFKTARAGGKSMNKAKIQSEKIGNIH